MNHRLPALLTDLYQLTMMQAYRRAGVAERLACFDLYFRRAPFRGAYAVACGVDQALEDLEQLRFTDDDLRYLRSLGTFDGDFVESLARFRFQGDVWTVPEGTVVFPREPILRVTAPLEQAQLVETHLLNRVNFQTLIATKASRIVHAARGRDVLEFGLRRAQGPDGGLSASRAAMVGGCAATSNVAAGQRFGVPVRGTHAHSYVTSFAHERDAFRNYAASFPSGVVLLVDTYDTLRSGLPAAIDVAHELAGQGGSVVGDSVVGERVVGVRLDSGDLVALSIEARRLLDEAGLGDVQIVASNDLDEHEITRMLDRGAPIDAFGVGTRLTTAFDDPALGGVYKLAARQRADGAWEPVFKRSDDPAKASLPGRKQVWRERETDGTLLADRVELDDADPPPGEPLLQPRMIGGRRQSPAESLEVAARRAADQLARLPIELRELDAVAAAPVSLGPSLTALRDRGR